MQTYKDKNDKAQKNKNSNANKKGKIYGFISLFSFFSILFIAVPLMVIYKNTPIIYIGTILVFIFFILFIIFLILFFHAMNGRRLNNDILTDKEMHKDEVHYRKMREAMESKKEKLLFKTCQYCGAGKIPVDKVNCPFCGSKIN